ncbi:TPR-like protein [Agrocybe pediades]|nr:TPR-like protein [Agrocybe pediades]
MGIAKMFSDPNMLGKLATNPRTQKHLSDSAFVQKLQAIQKNPALASSALQDPRMIDVLGALMGIDIQATERPEGSNDMPEGVRETPTPPASSSKPSQPTPPPPAQEDVEMEEVDEEEAKAKKDAEAAKAAGSAAYKKRDFAEAIKNFQLAWDTWPKDLTFLTNLGAAYFEQGDYDKAIEVCEKAVEEGRSVRLEISPNS